MLPTTTNETIIRAFAQQFDPPLNVCRTDHFNGVAIPDTWTASCWDSTRASA
jgi:hypothetical protein